MHIHFPILGIGPQNLKLWELFVVIYFTLLPNSECLQLHLRLGHVLNIYWLLPGIECTCTSRKSILLDGWIYFLHSSIDHPLIQSSEGGQIRWVKVFTAHKVPKDDLVFISITALIILYYTCDTVPFRWMEFKFHESRVLVLFIFIPSTEWTLFNKSMGGIITK